MVLSPRRGLVAGMLFYATLTAGSTASFGLSLIKKNKKKTRVLSAVMNVINSLKGEGKGDTANCVF